MPRLTTRRPGPLPHAPSLQRPAVEQQSSKRSNRSNAGRPMLRAFVPQRLRAWLRKQPRASSSERCHTTGWQSSRFQTESVSTCQRAKLNLHRPVPHFTNRLQPGSASRSHGSSGRRPESAPEHRIRGLSTQASRGSYRECCACQAPLLIRPCRAGWAQRGLADCGSQWVHLSLLHRQAGQGGIMYQLLNLCQPHKMLARYRAVEKWKRHGRRTGKAQRCPAMNGNYPS